MIITSSVTGNRPMPGFCTYAATKSFDSFIAEGLNFEFKDKIDVMSYKPSAVETLMNPRNKNSSTAWDMISAKTAV